jgi:D-alanyl-lipoteichoic acid acyltransferase DltB (MBOAT superfamily)
MASASLAFLGFAFAAILIYNCSRTLAWRQAILLIASLIFLALLAPSWQAYIPFAGFVLAGFFAVKLMEAGHHRWFAPVTAVVIALFMWLKRYAFLPSSLFLHSVYLTLGLSYILFRLLHLIIETRYGKLEGRVGFISYLNYTLNFATLVSGPIQLYPDFAANQLVERPQRLWAQTIGQSLERIILGFCKANVLAAPLASAHDWGIRTLSAGLPFETKLLAGIAAFAAYPFFLYCNFSGYIDMVIGVAQLMRNTLPENFNRPFSSDSFIGFWSRWHITLSEWLKTYVYYPSLMGLMRKYDAPKLEIWLSAAALFFTFFLVGLWHGQNSVFIFFGILQGFGVAANQVYETLLKKRMGRKGYQTLTRRPLYVIAARGATFTWFAFTMIWFWGNWGQIGALATSLGAAGILAVWAVIFVGASVLLAAWESLRGLMLGITWNGSPVVLSRYTRTAWATAALVISLAVNTLMNQAAPDIVYKAF